MKSFKKLLDKFDEPWYNITCWRCGKKFYHGFSRICTKCEEEMRDDNISRHKKTSKNNGNS